MANLIYFKKETLNWTLGIHKIENCIAPAEELTLQTIFMQMSARKTQCNFYLFHRVSSHKYEAVLQYETIFY